VFIGDRAWTANRAMILPRMTIGDDAVGGAGSVLVTDILERSLAMGSPARVIKKLCWRLDGAQTRDFRVQVIRLVAQVGGTGHPR